VEEIAKTDKYTAMVDKGKNRLYLTLKGYWKGPEEVPNYVRDMEKASKALRQGFTILTDMREFITPPPSLSAVHENAQKALVSRGLDRVAEVIPEKALMKLLLKRYAKSSQMKKMEFGSIKEAEAWLDSPGN